MRRSVVLFAILGLVTGCTGPDGGTQDREHDSDRVAVETLADRLAESITRLDAEGAAEGVPRDSSVVYVSDGDVIRGVDYISTLASFYSGLDSLQFQWTRKEISFPTPRSAVMIGWASIRAKSKGEMWAEAPAIFTLVYRQNEEGRWQYVVAQKTSVGGGGSPQAGGAHAEAAKAEIAQRISDYLEVLTAAHDADGARDAEIAGGYYTEDARVLGPGMDSDRPSLIETMRSTFESGVQVQVNRQTLEIFYHGDVAYEIARTEDVFLSPDGATADTLYNNMFIRWERGEDGKWRFDRALLSPVGSSGQ
ncbi:MAG: nuclear transport factor 2 family protein [Gemmatimonadota bacterium]|jgi:ketosteroid isomerase-like protein